MAKHELYIDFDDQDVPARKKDVVSKVLADGEKFGELRLSQGSVVWRGRGDKDGRKMSWAKFDRLMQEQAIRAERRPPGARVSVRREARR